MVSSVDGISPEQAKEIRDHYEDIQVGDAKIVAALPPGGAEILGSKGVEEYRKSRLASLPIFEKKRDQLLSRLPELRKRAAAGGTSVRGDVMSELDDISEELESVRREIESISGKDPGKLDRDVRKLRVAIALSEKPERLDYADDAGF